MRFTLPPSSLGKSAVGRLAAAVTGRRGCWVTIAVWVALAGAGLLADLESTRWLGPILAIGIAWNQAIGIAWFLRYVSRA